MDQGYLVVLSSELSSKPWEPLSSCVWYLSLGPLVQGFPALICLIISGKCVDVREGGKEVIEVTIVPVGFYWTG